MLSKQARMSVFASLETVAGLSDGSQTDPLE
jgi:hypothetical protein